VIREQIEKRAKTTAGIWKISQRDLSSIVVPVPPLQEQARIIAEIERRLSVAEQIATTIDAALARASRLRQSILKRAFEGNLVPQDPNDEPASVLLERIRAERTSREVAAPRRGRRPAEASASSLPRRRARGVRG
jgi:type I restriction enzyme S subunit